MEIREINKAALKVDKQNGDILYNDEHHIYWNSRAVDKKYTSVTTLISAYYEKFDSEYWLRYKAAEKCMGAEDFKLSGLKKLLLDKKKWDDRYMSDYDIDEDEFKIHTETIAAEWKKTSDDACTYGTNYHNTQENKFYEKKVHKMSDFNFGLDLTEDYQCEKHDFNLNREHAVLPEYLVYYSSPSGLLNIAGQLDVLIKSNNDIIICDFKTNAKGIESKAYFNPKTKKKKTMLTPLNNIEDTTLEHYTLQLSIYAYMLQQINPDFNIKLLRLIHVDRAGIETLYDVPYRKEEVIKLFKHYEKQLVIAHYRETGQLLTINKDL